MKSIIKTVGPAVVTFTTVFLFMAAAFDAADVEWEARAKKDFELRVAHSSEEPDLLNETYLATLRAQMPEDFRFADWGYPDFDEDGHCDLEADPELWERETAIMDFAILLNEQTGLDFEDCIAFAEANYNEGL